MFNENIQVESADRDHCIAVWNNVIICVWRSDPDAARFKKLLTLPPRFRTSGCYAVLVVEDRCPVPDDAARNVAVQFLKELSSHNGKGVVLVFEGAGFLAAATRAVMLGLMTASRVSIPYKVQQTVSQAEEFFRSEDPSGAFAPGRLLRAVESVRARIHSGVPATL